MEAVNITQYFAEKGAESPMFGRTEFWTTLGVGVILVSLGSTVIPKWRRPSAKLPLVNKQPLLDFSGKATKLNFTINARKFFEEARKECNGQPYRIMTDVGEIIILPGEFAHDIRNEPGLSFSDAFAHNFYTDLPGYEGFAIENREDNLFARVITKHVTKLLNQVTHPLSLEAQFACDRIYGSSTEWREFELYNTILDLIARLSSRVFLGDKLCRNEDWLSITKTYTVNGFASCTALHEYPSSARHLMQWFVPGCKTVRQQVELARRIVEPEVQRRRSLREQARKEGKPEPRFNDSIDWFEEESGGKDYDATGGQLGLSIVAIHTSTDLIVETVLRILDYPGLLDAMRKEIVDVLGTEGWKKTSLTNLKLMDSVLKEAQRLKPATSALMYRKATRPVTLSNGLKLEKGERCVVYTDLMRDSNVYEDPLVFDPYRFLKLRASDATGPVKGTAANLVTTSAAHMGFGHGLHACPGRFFASNEIKIALAHMLMKYDWQLAPDYKYSCVEVAMTMLTNTQAKVLVRKRETPEIDIDAIE